VEEPILIPKYLTLGSAVSLIHTYTSATSMRQCKVFLYTHTFIIKSYQTKLNGPNSTELLGPFVKSRERFSTTYNKQKVRSSWFNWYKSTTSLKLNFKVCCICKYYSLTGSAALITGGA
jgi:hypothetical protein